MMNLTNKKKSKALVLFSGGLDSLLAIKILEKQGIKVKAVCFESNFFNCKKAVSSARENKIDLEVVDISKEILKLTKNPPSGHGKNLNPCIDCHSLMIKKAEQIRKKIGYDFVATGEVLGQRPFSQNKNALRRVEKISGIEILRPLSAQKMSETDMEKKGLVQRKLLAGISGRSRAGQKELADRLGIENIPGSGGGCLLTEKGFSDRLAEMLDNCPVCSERDVEILKFGRVFWFFSKNKEKKALLMVGRDKADNEALEGLAKKGDFVLRLKDIKGPLAVLRPFCFSFEKKPAEQLKIKIGEKKPFDKVFDKQENLLDLSARFCAWHARRARGKEVVFEAKLINE